MELIRRLLPPRSAGPGFVATMGSFDGLHRGHQELLRRTRVRARERGARSLVITLEPLPREYFAPQVPPARLTNFRERWRQLERLSLDVLCTLAFNRRLRMTGAADFSRVLQHAQVRELVIGHDFHFARDREAMAEWLIREGPSFGFSVEVVEPVLLDGVRVSSSAVREALARGDLEAASRQLGRRYSMIGRVLRGQQLGRKLGFPTANLRVARRRSPLAGVFAVRVRGVRDDAAGRQGLAGVANLGTRPTVEEGLMPLLEAHVFDFDGDLYGREIEVEFVARLRDELLFESLDAMVAQMHRDAELARAVLAQDLRTDLAEQRGVGG